ncbi:glycosyltransferase [Parapedobacter deserti]|uniref:Glycosyltransferase n=2 Tax=Parapedobacter deserti TaxID=1912957 RepID=A0ABV7JPU9_9SPHI
MATYNGSEYLSEQLDSLLKQSYRSWRLLVHDDGSSDDTVRIVQNYQRMDRRVQLLSDGVRGLGAAGNYMHLLKYTNAPLCMFCDQDDVWFDDKVSRLVAAISNEQGPAAAYANAFFYESGRLTRKTIDIHPSSLKNMLFMNSGIQGCSLIVNRQLIELVRPFDGTVAMHDHLLTLASVAFGKLIYLDEVLMLYRQHEKNATADHQTGLSGRVRSFLSRNKQVIDRRHFEANRSFFDYFFLRLSPQARQLFEAYFRYALCPSVFGRLWLVWKHGFQLGNRKGLLSMKTLMRQAID